MVFKLFKKMVGDEPLTPAGVGGVDIARESSRSKQTAKGKRQNERNPISSQNTIQSYRAGNDIAWEVMGRRATLRRVQIDGR